MEELHHQQINGEVEMIPANNLGTMNDEYFKEEYSDFKIKAHNAHVYHIATERRDFKTVAGMPRKVSKSMVVKLTKEAFREMTKKGSAAFAGLTVHILHNPEGKQSSIKVDLGGDGDKDKDNGEKTITIEGINALTSTKEAKALYLEITGTEAVQFWGLDKVKEEIINFLGLGA